jgi:hypothetical protein
MDKLSELNENDITRIVRKVIKENKLASAMNFLDKFLQERGGTLGARSPREIMSDLDELERAIKLERNNLDVASKRPNPRWDDEKMDMDMDMGMDVDFDDNM